MVVQVQIEHNMNKYAKPAEVDNGGSDETEMMMNVSNNERDYCIHFLNLHLVLPFSEDRYIP